MATFVRTGFADEIADDLDEQLDVLEELGIEHLDLRSVWGTNILDLDADEVREVRTRLDERGFAVSAIGSPIGKIEITEPFEPHEEQFEIALDRAAQFDTEYVRLFSYWIPDGDDPTDWHEEVLRRMREKAERAEAVGVTLLHENEKDIYGDTPERCRDLVTAVDSPNLRLIFDPANFLEVGVRPYPDALLQVVEFVEFLHIKDATFGERGAIRPAGDGDGSIPELLAALRRRGFSGFASLEPHLAEAEAKGGFSGPAGFRRGARAFEACLETANATYV